MNEGGLDFNRVIERLSWNELPPEFLSSILALIIMLILTIAIHIKIKKYDPLKKPSGFINAVEMITEFADKQVMDIMGPAFKGFGGYILFVGLYIFLGFFIGMIGLPNTLQPFAPTYLEALPNPFTNMAMPLSIALITFILTHYTAIKYKHWTYFERYTEPIALFLPINLITMRSPVLSLTLRLFGNALAGYCIITLIYVGLGSAIEPYWGFVFEPVIAPFAHLYFDIFDGLIQLAVFTILTMINVSNEYISPEDFIKMEEEKKNKKLLKKKKREEKKALKKEAKSAV